MGKFLLGGIIGAGAALLLAPRSGEENRAILSEIINGKADGNYYCAAAKDQANGCIDQLAETSTKVINYVVDNGQEAMRNAVAQAEQSGMIDTAKEKANVALETLAETSTVVINTVVDNGQEAKRAIEASAEAGTLKEDAIDAVAEYSTKAINFVVDNGQEAMRNFNATAPAVIAPVVTDFNSDELREKIDSARERVATQVAKNAEVARDAAVDKIPAAVDAVASKLGK